MSDFVQEITAALERLRENAWQNMGRAEHRNTKVKILNEAINEAFALGRKYQRGDGIHMRRPVISVDEDRCEHHLPPRQCPICREAGTA